MRRATLLLASAGCLVMSSLAGATPASAASVTTTLTVNYRCTSELNQSSLGIAPGTFEPSYTAANDYTPVVVELTGDDAPAPGTQAPVQVRILTAIDPQLPFDLPTAEITTRVTLGLALDDDPPVAAGTGNAIQPGVAGFGSGGYDPPDVAASVYMPNLPGSDYEISPGEIALEARYDDDANPLTAPALLTVRCDNDAPQVPPATGAPLSVTTAGTPPFSSQSSCTVPTGGSCSTQQELSAEVLAGNLSQQATGTIVDMGTVTTPLVDTDRFASLNTIQVTDARGGTFGWSLTAQTTEFTSSDGSTIDADRLSINSLFCVGTAQSGTSTAGPGGSLDTAQTLCSVAPGVGGGQYDIGGSLRLSIPAFQRAGSYDAIVVVTLA